MFQNCIPHEFSPIQKGRTECSRMHPNSKIRVYLHLIQFRCNRSLIEWHDVKYLKIFFLTLSQTTNFGLFQTERVCRHNFKFEENGRKIYKKGRKHCGKRRNCSFSRSVFKRLLLQTPKNQGLFGKGLKTLT